MTTWDYFKYWAIGFILWMAIMMISGVITDQKSRPTFFAAVWGAALWPLWMVIGFVVGPMVVWAEKVGLME